MSSLLPGFRDRFHVPKHSDGSESIYLAGHSLGLQPKSVRRYLEQEFKDWELLGVEGHFRARQPWMPYHRVLTEQTARLVGAQPIEVVVMNSLTVNLHLMMVSFYRPTAERHKIVIENGAFPSDQYAVKSQIAFHGFNPATSLIELQPRTGETCLRPEDIRETIDREGRSIALVLLGAVNYATGQAFDIPGITETAHRNGCTVGWDLAHAAGNLLLRLHDWNPDFAVWCSYKYLNSGPGAIAGCFVHERHAYRSDLPRFHGWWGHDELSRFQMSSDFQAMPGAEGWQLSNPSILALAALRASMDIFEEAGMPRLRAWSETLTGHLESLLLQSPSSSWEIVTPADPAQRGAQLSVRLHSRGREFSERLIAQGIVCDWREPDILRVAPVPLYNTLHDVEAFAQAFRANLA